MKETYLTMISKRHHCKHGVTQLWWSRSEFSLKMIRLSSSRGWWFQPQIPIESPCNKYRWNVVVSSKLNHTTAKVQILFLGISAFEHRMYSMWKRLTPPSSEAPNWSAPSSAPWAHGLCVLSQSAAHRALPSRRGGVATDFTLKGWLKHVETCWNPLNMGNHEKPSFSTFFNCEKRDEFNYYVQLCFNETSNHRAIDNKNAYQIYIISWVTTVWVDGATSWIFS